MPSLPDIRQIYLPKRLFRKALNNGNGPIVLEIRGLLLVSNLYEVKFYNIVRRIRK